MPNDAVDIRDFIGLLKHSRGDFAGQPFVLEEWQDSYFDRLLNTKRADGLRQYRTSLLALPRKNGKTQMAAALGLYMLFCDDVGLNHNYSHLDEHVPLCSCSRRRGCHLRHAISEPFPVLLTIGLHHAAQSQTLEMSGQPGRRSTGLRLPLLMTLQRVDHHIHG